MSADRPALDGPGLHALLAAGHARRLFSGASAVVSRGSAPVGAQVGTLGFDDPTPVSGATTADLASLTKVFSACVVLALADVGALDLDRPTDRGPTLAQLLSHTSGLPAESDVWRRADLRPAQRLQRALDSPPTSAPAAVFRYSCVGYVTAGHLAEEATGQGLDALVEEFVTGPLGTDGPRFGPVPAGTALATEGPTPAAGTQQEVHDEFAASLRRPCGNAGLFGTAAAVHAVGAMVLAGGRAPDGREVLSPGAVARLTTNVLTPAQGAGPGHGLGLRIGDPAWTVHPDQLGHTGFTGTSLLLDPARDVVAVLLTNRVHPDRALVDLDPFRRKFARAATGR